MNAVKSLLVGIILLSFNLSAVAQSNDPFETLQQIRKGVQVGLYERLSPEQKVRVSQLLTETRDIIYASSSQSKLTCISQGNGFYILGDVDTGKTLGSSIYGLQGCRDTLPEVGNPFACLSQGNGFYGLTDLRTGNILGQSVYGLNSCKEAAPKTGQKIACVSQGNGFWILTNLQNGITLGTSVYGLATCKASLP